MPTLALRTQHKLKKMTGDANHSSYKQNFAVTFGDLREPLSLFKMDLLAFQPHTLPNHGPQMQSLRN
jgi:hypothetical protein